jgi:hypothetical protein
MKNEEDLLESMRMFDKVHFIKQIIFIGEDGVCRNYEFDLVNDESDLLKDEE